MKSKTYKTILLLEILVFSILFVGFLLAAYNIYVNKAKETYQAGNQAYRDAEYLAAYEMYQKLTSIYRFSSLPEISVAQARMDECSLLVYAQISQQQDIEASIQAQEVFLEKYPRSSIAPDVQDKLARLYYQKAQQYMAFANYQSALQIYLDIQKRFPDSLISNVIDSSIAQLYLSWGDSLQQNGDLTLSIEKYQVILDHYRNTPVLESAVSGLNTAVTARRQSLLNSGEYEQLIQEDQFLLDKYSMYTPATALLKQISKGMPEVYGLWGDSLRAQAEYEKAIDIYLTILTQYPDKPAAVNARENIIPCYTGLSGQLRQSGNFDQALEMMHEAVTECSNTSCSEEFFRSIQEENAQTYLEWGRYLKISGDLDHAKQKFSLVLAGYLVTPAAQEAMNELTRIQLEQAQELVDTGKRLEAFYALVQAHELEIRSGIAPAGDLSSQLEAVRNALVESLLAESGDESTVLMADGAQRACNGIPAIYLDFPFGGQSALGMVCQDAFQLTDDLRAITPSDLRYVIRRTEKLQSVQVCRYDNDVKITRQQRIWVIEVISLETGTVVDKLTFLGDPPPTCPGGQTKPTEDTTLIGEAPSENEIAFWLRTVMK